nr:surfeit locus protein 6 [Pelodiscus sinensis]|eukprot:XP_006123783.1 surfeit locus protein 6 [Pelodiscus sinensis]
MASLAIKDSYLQSLAQKICVQQVQEPWKRKLASKRARAGDASSQPKKKKRKKPRKQAEKANVPPAKQAVPNTSKSAKQTASNLNSSTPAEQTAPSGNRSTPAKTAMRKSEKGSSGGQSDPGSFSAVNLLRQKLHEKMQEVSGQGGAKELSPAVLEKRRRRKYEKERKKRRRKELKMKEKMEKEGAQEAATAVEPQQVKEESKDGILFNRVKVCEEEELSQTERKKEKRKRVKGNLTPLTGKNYKQLLSRLEARKSKLEELKDKDQKKAQELENKMKWTNVLYKAEGVKIRDDEDRLKAALKRKEKRKAQRQKQWGRRTEHVVEKMQQRQDKRRKNIQKKKLAKVEHRKDRARKKGRILPEDLEKAGVK